MVMQVPWVSFNRWTNWRVFRTTCTLLKKNYYTNRCCICCYVHWFFTFFCWNTSFGGGYSESFGSTENLLLGTITLAAFLLFNIFAKSYWKQLSVLFGLIVGYILAIFMGKVDLSVIFNGGLIALSHLLPFKMKFDLGRLSLSSLFS